MNISQTKSDPYKAQVYSCANNTYLYNQFLYIIKISVSTNHVIMLATKHEFLKRGHVYLWWWRVSTTQYRYKQSGNVCCRYKHRLLWLSLYRTFQSPTKSLNDRLHFFSFLQKNNIHNHLRSFGRHPFLSHGQSVVKVTSWHGTCYSFSCFSYIIHGYLTKFYSCSIYVTCTYIAMNQ